MIEAFGEKAVKINGTIIPSCNVQVDGYPTKEFPIYFEIMFEYGFLWIVEFGLGDTLIRAEHYLNYGNLPKNDPGRFTYYERFYENWNDFLHSYDLYNRRIFGDGAKVLSALISED